MGRGVLLFVGQCSAIHCISFHSLHDPLMLSLEIVTVVRHLCPGLLFPFENKYGFLEFSILFFKEQWLTPKHLEAGGGMPAVLTHKC